MFAKCQDKDDYIYREVTVMLLAVGWNVGAYSISLKIKEIFCPGRRRIGAISKPTVRPVKSSMVIPDK
jgi:hypothetical protein